MNKEMLMICIFKKKKKHFQFTGYIKSACVQMIVHPDNGADRATDPALR